MADPDRQATLKLLKNSTYQAPDASNGYTAAVNFTSMQTTSSDAAQAHALIINDLAKNGIRVIQSKVEEPIKSTGLHGKKIEDPAYIMFQTTKEDADKFSAYMAGLEKEIHPPTDIRQTRPNTLKPF